MSSNNGGRSLSDSVLMETEAEDVDESTLLLHRRMSHGDVTVDHDHHLPIRRSLKRIHSTWIPREDKSDLIPSIRRGIFLLLTEPNSSVASLIFFGFLVTAITLSNVIMILQTMEQWQYTPTDCVTCGG